MSCGCGNNSQIKSSGVSNYDAEPVRTRRETKRVNVQKEKTRSYRDDDYLDLHDYGRKSHHKNDCCKPLVCSAKLKEWSDKCGALFATTLYSDPDSSAVQCAILDLLRQIDTLYNSGNPISLAAIEAIGLFSANGQFLGYIPPTPLGSVSIYAGGPTATGNTANLALFNTLNALKAAALNAQTITSSLVLTQYYGNWLYEVNGYVSLRLLNGTPSTNSVSFNGKFLFDCQTGSVKAVSLKYFYDRVV